MEVVIVVALALIGAALNRLRGGWFSNICRALVPTLEPDTFWRKVAMWGSQQRTQTMRLIWATPTGLLLWSLTGYAEWLWLAFIVSCFAGYAMLGHGAHMVYRIEEVHHLWRAKPNDPQTELTTRWLPLVFGGAPGPLWPESKIWIYHMIGMSFIGLLRSAIMLSPIWWTSATFAGSFALVLSGLLLGPLYWLGGRIQDSRAAELIVGAFYWATFYLILGT
jgi:hypothetical protein